MAFYDDLNSLLLLIIAVLLLSICLFLADKLIGNKPNNMGGGYFLKALLTAIVVIVLIIVGYTLANLVGFFGIGRIGPILAFVLAAYGVKILLLERADYEKAIWVTLVAYIFVFIINYLSQVLGGPALIPYI